MMDPIWLIYAGIFVGPFVQEDAAVIAAASLSASDPKHFPIVFVVILLGLFVSDIWKYWIGYHAHRHPRFRKWAEKDRVIAMREQVERHAVKTLLIARFLPLARVPAYVACGYFKMNYAKFCAIMFGTAALYCTVIFAMCHWLGEIFGERMEIVILIMAAIVIVVAGSALAWKRWISRRD